MARLSFAFKVFFSLASLIFVSCTESVDDHSTTASHDNNSSRADEAIAKSDTAENDPLEVAIKMMSSIDRAYRPEFAPDGERLLYVSSETGSPQIFITGKDSSETRQATFFDDLVLDARWSPRDDIIAVEVAPGGGQNSQLYLTPVDGGEPKQITAGGNTNNWLITFSDDGRFLSYASNVAGNGSMDAYLYDLDTGESRLIAENPGIGYAPALSPDSEKAVIWRMVSRGKADLYLLDLKTGAEQHITAQQQGVSVSRSPVFSDNQTVYFRTNFDREMITLAKIDIDETGHASPIKIVAERNNAELESFDISPDGKMAALMWNAAGRSELSIFNLTTSEILEEPELPADIAGDVNFNADGSAITFSLSGAAAPSNIWTYSLADNKFKQITDSAHEGVYLDKLVRPELVTYKAHDGLELSGWLYRAPGVDGPGPIVLDFHGGPEGQERPSFNSTIQAFMTQGISIFAPNVRGSSGFGKTFVNLDNGAKRFNAIKDIKTTADHLIELKVADPERLGIMGASYGGYMVMAGITEYPELFAAAANLYGIINFETFFANTEAWMAMISTVEYGDPVTETQLLRDLSPIHKVDRIITPTIVLHGANDTNVPVIEAEQTVASLEERNVPVKYILFPDEGHGWGKTENRFTSTIEMVRWFQKYL